MLLDPTSGKYTASCSVDESIFPSNASRTTAHRREKRRFPSRTAQRARRSKCGHMLCRSRLTVLLSLREAVCDLFFVFFSTTGRSRRVPLVVRVETSGTPFPQRTSPSPDVSRVHQSFASVFPSCCEAHPTRPGPVSIPPPSRDRARGLFLPPHFTMIRSASQVYRNAEGLSTRQWGPCQVGTVGGPSEGSRR